MEAQDKAAVIVTWWKKKKGGCSLHRKADDHQFLNCNHIHNICADCNCIEALAKVIAKGNNAAQRGGDPDGGNARAQRMVLAEQINNIVKAK